MTGLKKLSLKTKTVLLPVIVFLISFAVYFNTIFNGFVMDDYFQVLENPWIRNMATIPEIFTRGVWEFRGEVSSYYRPLMHIIYMASYHAFGLSPWGFHLVNIFLHSGISVLVFLILLKLLRESGYSSPLIPAFIAAVLFAVHPIHTESVAWVAGVIDLSFAFFALLAFFLHIRSLEGMRGGHVLSVVCFFAASLCKETALTLPFFLFVYDVAVRKEKEGLARYLKRYIPYALAAGMYFVLRIHALKVFAPWKSQSDWSPAAYALDIMFLFSKYIEKLLFPVNLNNWHFYQPPTSYLSADGIISLAVTAIFLGALFLTAKAKRSRLAFLGLLFVVVPLLPTFYLPALTQGIKNAFMERYLYLPSVGFVLLIALLIAGIKDRGPGWAAALVTAFSIATVLYSIGTVSRNAAWKDSYTLWSDAATKSPGSAEPYNALGDYFKEKGMLDEAIEQYRRGLRISPQTAHLHSNLGVVYALKGNNDQAVKQIKTALLLRPGFPDAHDSLGVIYARMGRYDEAIREFQAAADLNPRFESAYKHLGIAYGDMGQTDKAVQYLNKALDIDPKDADAHNTIGIAFGMRGFMDEAVKHFETAVRLKPDDPVFHYNLAGAYQKKGLASMAAEQMRIAEGLKKR
jgi:tetratricopeptide (TPR) repeat protein